MPVRREVGVCWIGQEGIRNGLICGEKRVVMSLIADIYRDGSSVGHSLFSMHAPLHLSVRAVAFRGTYDRPCFSKLTALISNVLMSQRQAFAWFASAI